MASNGASFLPRIESVFYAVFDVRQGPKIVYQVPEGLISASSTSTSTASTNPLYSPSTTVSTPTRSSNDPSTTGSRTASSGFTSPVLPRMDSRSFLLSPQKRSASSNRVLFNFDDISKYIIPPSALCGRLVICAARKHRVIGFPVELRGNYERNYFRYNLCFVFERTADLSCYEPVVRKVSRVLTACEEESAFLSSPQSSPAIHAILEQLYEDLNSYSETSIAIDNFNAIELKIFPFYPNPPAVKDWQVPLALINLTSRIEPNWDLTMVKVCRFINGTNHVSRIARLAECDIELTREAISHLLYYQVIMMIDIFQYSNMYTLRPSVQWLADEAHVRDECGPYATKPGRPIPDWPKLLHLYSRLKPGKTVREWVEEYNVDDFGVDVRRFTTFGVIKGFLRRIHRWPILIRSPGTDKRGTPTSNGRKRGKSFVSTPQNSPPNGRPEPDPTRARGRPQEPLPTIASAGAELVAAQAPRPSTAPRRRPSAAENSLEQLRNITHRDGRAEGALPFRTFSPGDTSTTRRRADIPHFPTTNGAGAPPGYGSVSPPPIGSSPDALGLLDQFDSEHSSGGRSAALGFTRPKLSRSPSAPTVPPVVSTVPQFPPELLPLLDGEHHTDELCTQFAVGWPVLKRWLVAAGGGEGDDDFGEVSIIYR